MTALLAKIFGSIAIGAVLLAVALHFLAGYNAGQQAIGAAKVQATIDAPVTGWAARLKQAQDNAKALQAGLDQQSAATAAQAAKDAADLAQARTALRAAQAASARAQTAAGRVMAPLPVAPECDRLTTVDARLMAGVQ